MAVLDLNNGGYIVLDEGGLASLASGSTSQFTIEIIFKRDAATTNSRQNLIEFYNVAGSFAPIEVGLLNTGGFWAMFNGFQEATYGTNPSNGVWFKGVLKGTFVGGSTQVRMNLYNYTTDSWLGWVNAGSVDNTSTTLGSIRIGSESADWPLDGKIAEAAVWTTNLADATVTDGTNGLHISSQKVFDLSPVEMWRPGETNPVVSDTPSGTADETSEVGSPIIVTGEDPDSYSLTLGGGGGTAKDVTDSATITDSMSVAAETNNTDTATQTDALSITAQVAFADTFTFVDSMLVERPTPMEDTGTQTEALAITAQIAMSDTWTFSDSMTVGGSASPNVSDSAALTDAMSVAAQAPLADTHTLTETMTIAVTLSLADTHSLIDSMSVNTGGGGGGSPVPRTAFSLF